MVLPLQLQIHAQIKSTVEKVTLAGHEIKLNTSKYIYSLFSHSPQPSCPKPQRNIKQPASDKLEEKNAILFTKKKKQIPILTSHPVDTTDNITLQYKVIQSKMIDSPMHWDQFDLFSHTEPRSTLTNDLFPLYSNGL